MRLRLAIGSVVLLSLVFLALPLPGPKASGSALGGADAQAAPASSPCIIAPKKLEALLEDALWVVYLKRKGFERDIGDHTRAFNPETGQNAHYDKKKRQWIDSGTGKPLSRSGLGPRAEAVIEDALWVKHLKPEGFERDPGDHTRAFNPETGQNAHYDKKKRQWIDSKTGKPLSPSACLSVRVRWVP